MWSLSQAHLGYDDALSSPGSRTPPEAATSQQLRREVLRSHSLAERRGSKQHAAPESRGALPSQVVTRSSASESHASRTNLQDDNLPGPPGVTAPGSRVDASEEQDHTTLQASSPQASIASSLQIGNEGDNEAIFALRQLREKHEKLVSRRVTLSEQCESVRRQREVVRSMETALVEHLMQLLETSSPAHMSEPIAQLAQIRHEREEQDRLEVDFDESFEVVVAEEFQTAQMESRFYEADVPEDQAVARLSASVVYQPEEIEDPYSSSNMRRYGRDPSPDSRTYLSLTGDRQLLIEHMEELQARRDYLASERLRRMGLGVSLDPESSQILSNFDGDYRELKLQLQRLEDAIREVQERQERRGQSEDDDVEVIIRNAIGNHHLPNTTSLPSIDISRRAGKAPAHRTTSPAGGAIDFSTSSATHDNEEGSNIHGFVDTWLLEQLQQSPDQQRAYLSIAREKEMDPASEVNLGQRILDTWHSDPATARSPGARDGASLDLARSPDLQPQRPRKTAHSDSEIPRRTSSLPLLQIDADTPAASIISRARQELQPSSHASEATKRDVSIMSLSWLREQVFP